MRSAKMVVAMTAASALLVSVPAALGAAPTAAPGAIPTAARGAIPTAARGAIPTAARGAIPTATRGAIPTATRGAIPAKTSRAKASPALASRLRGGCRIDINVAPREITAGDPVTIFGRLACRGHSEAGQVVKLFHHVDGSFGFTYVQSTTTAAHGFYAFNRADGLVVSNRSWYVRSAGAQSAAKRIKVAADVTLSGPAEGSQLLTGRANHVTFTGTVNPADVGARIILQRQNATTGSEWRRIDRGVVQPGGSFSIVHTFLVPGDANIRVLVRSQGRDIPSPSTNVLEYEISQAQNPALTIVASADPIQFGQSVTITGVLAGGANRSVQLMARTRAQGAQGWTAVAEASTDANGNYAFPAQSPTNSTFYRVVAPALCKSPSCPAALTKSAVLKSAVLFEGVRDVLSAQVSATSVQAGGQLTFTGTVAPSHAGHVIYLERENAFGGGFHVVQVGTVNPDSSYSLIHTVYDPGTKVFRVYIPGGPENQGAASQPFTIQVTPGPAAALMQEPPGNSSLPSAGSEAPGEAKEETEKP
jgi:hypothetical protein